MDIENKQGKIKKINSLEVKDVEISERPMAHVKKIRAGEQMLNQ